MTRARDSDTASPSHLHVALNCHAPNLRTRSPPRPIYLDATNSASETMPQEPTTEQASVATSLALVERLSILFPTQP